MFIKTNAKSGCFSEVIKTSNVHLAVFACYLWLLINNLSFSLSSDVVAAYLGINPDFFSSITNVYLSMYTFAIDW